MGLATITKHSLFTIFFIWLILFCCAFFREDAEAQIEDLEVLFSQAQTEPELRHSYIKSYIEQKGLPAHVRQVIYSEKIKMVAVSNPLVQTPKGDYTPTSHALAIGRGYPSRMTFGPKMFQPAYNYADFVNVVQHEAAHAKFWATGSLNYLDDVDTGKDSKVRLRGLFPILFELDAIKTQMEHPSWQQTSEPFRRGQMAYRHKWLEKLDNLAQQSYTYELRPLLKQIRRIYGDS